MTDWTRRLLPASFNGQPFFVESADIETGHRVATTNIPNAKHVNESFGPAPRKFEVEAYLTGLACRERAASLLSAGEMQHRGLLVLPDAGSTLVRLTKAKRSFAKDKLGFVALTLEAVAEPTQPGPAFGLSPAALASRVFGLATGAVAAVGGFVALAFRVVGFVSSVREAALSVAAGVLGDLVALREAVRLPPAGRDAVMPYFDAATLALADLAADPAGFGTALAEAAIALGDAADPALLAQTIIAFGPPAEAPPAQVSQGSAVIIAEQAAQGVALIAATRALALGEALARQEFRDRAEAVNARTIATTVFDDALGRIGREGLDLARELGAIKGTIAELTARLEADIAPLVGVSAGRRLPSLVWAWSLYADPLRAEGLAHRAGVPHPGFMPERFDALAA